MATIRQKKLAKKIVKNLSIEKPLNKLELVASVGYSKMSAEKKATEIIESKGVKKELEILGFTSENAKSVVSELLNNPYEESAIRLNAAKEVFKVFGDYAAEKTLSLNVNSNIEDLQEAIKDDLKRFRG